MTMWWLQQRMFPIDIQHIGRGYVQGVGKLITKKGGQWVIPSAAAEIEVSRYLWGVLVARSRVAHAPGESVWLALGEGEVAIVEDIVA